MTELPATPSGAASLRIVEPKMVSLNLEFGPVQVFENGLGVSTPAAEAMPAESELRLSKGQHLILLTGSIAMQRPIPVALRVVPGSPADLRHRGLMLLIGQSEAESDRMLSDLVASLNSRFGPKEELKYPTRPSVRPYTFSGWSLLTVEEERTPIGVVGIAISSEAKVGGLPVEFRELQLASIKLG